MQFNRRAIRSNAFCRCIANLLHEGPRPTAHNEDILVHACLGDNASDHGGHIWPFPDDGSTRNCAVIQTRLHARLVDSSDAFFIIPRHARHGRITGG